MVEEGTLCGNTDVEKLSGEDASSTADAEAYTNVYIKMIEGDLCHITRYDWVTNYTSVSSIGKEVLRLSTAAGAAALVINYQMNGYRKANARQMMNFLWAMYERIIGRIRDKNIYKEFILSGEGDID